MGFFRHKTKTLAELVEESHVGYRRSPQNDLGALVFGSHTEHGIESTADCWVPDDWCVHDAPPTQCKQCNPQTGTW